MKQDVQKQLLKLYDLSTSAAPAFPPSVGIELRVAGGAHRDPGLVAPHGPTKHPAQTPRVIGSSHHHDGAEPILVAPLGEDLPFILRSRHRSGDLLDEVYAQSPESSSGSCRRVLVRDSPAYELAVHNSVWRVGKHGHF